MPCEVCHHFAKKKGKIPDCDNCLGVELLPENEEVFFIYSIVQNQVIFAQTVPIDINYESLRYVMDLYGVENKRQCFEKVVSLWHKMASLNRTKQEKENAAKSIAGKPILRHKSR